MSENFAAENDRMWASVTVLDKVFPHLHQWIENCISADASKQQVTATVTHSFHIARYNTQNASTVAITNGSCDENNNAFV